MKIGVTGSSGTLGKALLNRGAIPLDCDIKDLGRVESELDSARPDLIIHMACKSNVDWCEKPENQEEVIQTNVRGAYYVALAAEDRKIPMLALSTDHIFNGRRGPYKESYRKTIPINFYGQSKLAMETVLSAFKNVKVIRTSNVFSDDDHRMFDYMDTLALEYPVHIPTFQYRSFMYIEHFIDSLLLCVQKFYEIPNLLHISGSKTVSWYDFFVAFYGQSSLINKKKRDDKGFVPRPKKAGLNTELSKKLGFPQYDYLDGIKEMKK